MTRTSVRLATALAGVLALTAALAAPSSAAPKKFFSEILKAPALTPGTSSVLTFTLTNDSSSQSFGSAEILVPNYYNATAASVDDVHSNNFSATPTTTPLGVPVVLVTSTGSSTTGIQPNDSLQITVAVTVPATSCGAVWTTYVKQSNDFSGTGNDFTPLDPAPTTTVGTNKLAFTTQPGTTQYNNAMSPAPVVTLLDPCGNPVTSFTKPVSLTANGGAPLTGSPVTVTAMAGVATFSGLTFTDYGATDTLTASTTDYADVTSSPFDVVQSLTVCSAGATCSTGTIYDPAVTTLVNITADAGASADVLTASVKGDPNEAYGSCGQPVTTTAEPALGAIVTFNVTTRTKHAVMTLPKAYVNQIPNNGTPFMDICLDVPTTADQFVDKFGVLTYTGLLPDCTTTIGAPCITDRRKRAGDEIISFDLPAGDPRASWY